MVNATRIFLSSPNLHSIALSFDVEDFENNLAASAVISKPTLPFLLFYTARVPSKPTATIFLKLSLGLI